MKKLKVYCNVCKKHIYNLLKEIKEGAICSADHFEGANKNIANPINGKEMLCPLCGNSYIIPINGVYILTEDGVKP